MEMSIPWAIYLTEIYAVLPWIGVLLACTTVLAVAALASGFLSLKRAPKGWLRLLIVLDFAGAAGCGVAAWVAYSAYLTLLPSNLPRSFPPDYRNEYLRRVSVAVNTYSTIGWIAVTTTAILLVLSGFVAIRGRSDRPAGNSAAAHEERLPSESKA